MSLSSASHSRLRRSILLSMAVFESSVVIIDDDSVTRLIRFISKDDSSVGVVRCVERVVLVCVYGSDDLDSEPEAHPPP